MKLKQLVLIGGLITLFSHTHTHTQAQEPKWSIHNHQVDYVAYSLVSLLRTLNPDYTQNAIWDKDGNHSIT